MDGNLRLCQACEPVHSGVASVMICIHVLRPTGNCGSYLDQYSTLYIPDDIVKQLSFEQLLRIWSQIAVARWC